MRRTAGAILLALVVGLGLVLVLPDVATNEAPSDGETAPPARTDRHVERVAEGTVLRVVNGAGTEVLRYSIDTFNAWTAAHWDDVFEERPAFGDIRPVDFDSFRQFDAGAALSPSGEMVAFSVSDYAAATTLSFVAFLDVDADTVALVDDVKRGQVDEVHWSPGGRYVAYRLHTARAHGDGLSVDRAAPPKQMVALTGQDVLAALDTAGATPPSTVQPAFDDLAWTGAGRLSFSSRTPDGGPVQWRVEADGWALERTE